MTDETKRDNNVYIGHDTGVKSTGTNNILVGDKLDATGDTIQIGTRDQTDVCIGNYDLHNIMDRIKELEALVEKLDDDIIQLYRLRR